WRGTDQGSIPDTRRPLCSWRTAMLVFAPLFVCAYALSVLVYVQGVPDFGLRCAFTTVINRVHTNHLRPESGQLIPAPGDRIVQVGKYPIHTWPDLLRANEKLGSESVESEQPQAERSSQATHIQRDGEELVLVKFQKQGPDDQPVGPEDSIWCLLDRLHMESLVPSLLWFLLKGGLF